VRVEHGALSADERGAGRFRLEAPYGDPRYHELVCRARRGRERRWVNLSEADLGLMDATNE
jgi:hypothetical protein